ncbi:MAG: hypothetical protein LKJ39_09390 [Liquorilactobacillus nagelii]|uniref:hypothetical protein n=1 Tax=Liquorilactobacillus nagelii TaxID=82688 RepID=UPI00242B739B|nr:hypothetical protein [Liquorilactobacillus nagelii]MCI1977502.1 hypothetical protein [Liquorilactobacillus nagelii]
MLWSANISLLVVPVSLTKPQSWQDRVVLLELTVTNLFPYNLALQAGVPISTSENALS